MKVKISQVRMFQCKTDASWFPVLELTPEGVFCSKDLGRAPNDDECKLFIEKGFTVHDVDGKPTHYEVQPLHKFEAAGLGKAPFFYRGMAVIPSSEVAEKNPSGYQNMMKDIPPAFHCGTCAYCGLAIMNNYLVASSDDKFFSVGMDCIKKIDDLQILRKASREERFRKKLKIQVQIDEGMKLIDEYRNLLELEPHPEIPEKSLWDYAEWMDKNAGQSGKLRMVKLCLKVLNKTQREYNSQED